MKHNWRICAARLSRFPTPVAGLALGIASLGFVIESSYSTEGFVQGLSALLASMLLGLLLLRFVLHPKTLIQDLSHPVVGSVAPTFAMALMLVSNAVARYLHPFAGSVLWILAIVIHLAFLAAFCYHRSRQFNWTDMGPSWFVPPVGIIVAALAYLGPVHGVLYWLAVACLWFGMACFSIMLPMMFYRFIFKDNIEQGAQPTIAILAAPASLSMAGYLTIEPSPSALIVLSLFGISLLMTFTVYLSFFKLLRLPFSPGYAAFTFPMVIGASCMFKTADLLNRWGVNASLVEEVLWLARFELLMASLVVAYVSFRFIYFFVFTRRHQQL
ncbi:TDT family transporter [Agarivorans aestuarii]|uniref:TDT family transporter n=1 Tax=Agarivorans aestuarii TaxID=1563703 RepID=UPI001C7FB08D|nr:TDT family transporter [Agarivorans aestuarii]